MSRTFTDVIKDFQEIKQDAIDMLEDIENELKNKRIEFSMTGSGKSIAKALYNIRVADEQLEDIKKIHKEYIMRIFKASEGKIEINVYAYYFRESELDNDLIYEITNEMLRDGKIERFTQIPTHDDMYWLKN